MTGNGSACPFCGKLPEKKISAGLLNCRECGIIFNSNHKSLSYDRDYFVSEYNRQYGKTYLDDFDNIYTLSLKRLQRIYSAMGNRKEARSLLDIGSAMGFFLKAAKDSGIEQLTGVEISGFAADYCTENFGISVIQTPFENSHMDGTFDVITSWFFLEHLEDPAGAIARIYSMLNSDGVFAMAIPSWFGPLFFIDRDKWIETHPEDHRIDLSPKSVKKILKDAGFRRVSVSICGYHPERVVGRNNLLFRLFEILYRGYSHLTGFSDTIEIYAVK